MFRNALDVSSSDRILDVGGTEQTWINTGLERNTTILNLKVQGDNLAIRQIVGDGCHLDMFEDNAFDVVYSNSVIEHVGDFEKQRQFAREVGRVGKRIWIQTPYKHFPIEPHFIFPFFQYLPFRLKKFVGLKWKYSHLRKNREDILEELSHLHLLTKKSFHILFPDAEIIQEKFMGLTKSMIACRK